MADIDLSEYENWEPIGTEENPFSGTFNGKNKTISNLKINTSNAYQGLFGYIKGNSSTPILIENLNVEGNITANTHIGGIAGYIDSYNSDLKATVENCSFSGNITSTNTTNTSSAHEEGSATGGIVGKLHGNSENTYVINCKTSGTIKASNWVLGGIVGYLNMGSIIDCKNEAVVNIAKEDQRYAGGIVGYAKYDTNVVKCINTGKVQMSRGSLGCSSWYAGGIAGNAMYCNVIACINTAEIIAQTYEFGIVGYEAANIISCYNVGKINDSGAFGAGYWGTIAHGADNSKANYYGGSCTGTPYSSMCNGTAFSTDDYTDEITAMNDAIQEYATSCESEFIKSHLSTLKYKLNEDESTKGTMPLIFE